MTREATINRLVELRYLATKTPTETEAVRAEQQFQLDVGGQVSSAPGYTDELLSQPICGVPEAVMRNGIALWPESIWKTRPLRIGLASDLPALVGATNGADWRSIVREVLDEVQDVCGLRFEIVAFADADSVITAASIDGQNGVLADQELPTGVELQRALRMRLDRGERWDYLLAKRTLRHEGGHAWGLDHIPASYGRAVMNPTLQALNAWQPLDVAQLVARYPKASAPKVDPPGPFVPTPTGELVIRVKGGNVSIDGHRIIKAG